MFSADIKSQAMIACGRRCCLCHKFCGVGMECHHIIEVTHGGSDAFENCIPLCFDCHAEVGHYNNSHPKGVKFSAEELTAHRDTWYSNVSRGATQMASEYIEMDRSLVRKLIGLLGGYESMRHFRSHDYGNLYSDEVEKRLSDFFHESEKPGCEFFDLLVEGAFAELMNSVVQYRFASVNRVWCEVSGLAGVPQEWCNRAEGSEKRFCEAVEVMNGKAGAIWDSYSLFVREVRRRLRIEVEE